MPNVLSSLTATSTVFTAYAITVLVLCFNMMVLWGMSGGKRGTSKKTANPEDTKSVIKGGEVTEVEAPEVTRVLRAHRNAVDNIVPFLFIGLIYVMLAPSPMVAQIIFGFFVAMRLMHSIVYLAGKQPWRTIAYALSVLAMIALMGDTIRLLVK